MSYGSNITAGSGSNGNGGDVNVASRTSIIDASPSNETEEYAGQKSSFDNIAASEAEEEVNQRNDTNGSSLIPSGKQHVVTLYTVPPPQAKKVSKGKEKDDNSGDDSSPPQRKKLRKSGEKKDRVSSKGKAKNSGVDDRSQNSGDGSRPPQRKKLRKSGEKKDRVSSEGKAKNSGVDDRSQKEKDIWLVSVGKCNGKCHKNQCGKDAVATFASSHGGESWNACVACAEP